MNLVALIDLEKVMKINALILLVISLIACQPSTKKTQKRKASTQINSKLYSIELSCNDSVCAGTYVGPEFINGSDIAHQFSNKMCDTVGKILKELYKKRTYVKVNFDSIVMTTAGMGSGQVNFYLKIPFIKVKDSCSAYTSFDHCGGWRHTPALEMRKKELNTIVLPGEKLVISPLKRTREGLLEYWIQWKNKEVQKNCVSK